MVWSSAARSMTSMSPAKITPRLERGRTVGAATAVVGRNLPCGHEGVRHSSRPAGSAPGAPRRGPLARLAGPSPARARQRRHALFLDQTDAGASTRIVDIGCGTLGLRALAPRLDVTRGDRVCLP